VSIGQYSGCLAAKFFKYDLELFKPPCVDGLEEAAFLNAVYRSNIFTSVVILLKDLKHVTSRDMLFEMEENQHFELIFEGHFKRSVSTGLKYRYFGDNIPNRLQKLK